MKPTRLAPWPLALLVALAACGDDDDPTGVTGDALNGDEVAALAEVVAGTMFSTFEQTPEPPQAPGPALATGSFSLNTSLPCELGGVVAVSGTLLFDIDDETGDGTLDYTVTQDHQDCVAEAEDGMRFTLNGAPNVSADFVATLEGTGLTFAGGYVGAVSWVTGARSGTCSMDVDFSLTGDVEAETGTASISGTVCGVNFTHTLTFT